MKPFVRINRILIANRSEVARRIAYSCKSLGMTTLSIYTKEDISSPHVYETDEAYELALPGSAGYLNAENIIAIALAARADAIHPGYGFLSEKAYFAELVQKAGLIWIGPHPEAIRLAGDKTASHKFAKKLQIPVIQGSAFLATELEAARFFAEEIGYPVMLKSAHGGGGKAMRIVWDAPALNDNWKAVASESIRLFHTDSILLESYIPRARHIEVQVAGDGTNVVHFFERECSVQRRNQKIIEEAPCTSVPAAILDQLYAASIVLGKALAYNNIGTVEFLLTPDNKFYFIEMNTRLQVEHAVTELTTGIDLVWLQLYLAEHQELPMNQSNISRRGHAIECRVYAEDPAQNFIPSTGEIAILELPQHPFVRIDHALEEDIKVTAQFDPMIAKIIAHGYSRDLAINNLKTALKKIMINGLTTNINFLIKMLCSEEFKNNSVFTSMLDNHETVKYLISCNDSDLPMSKETKKMLLTTLNDYLKDDQTLDTKINTKVPESHYWKMRSWK